MVLFLFSGLGNLNAQLPPNHPWYNIYTWPDGTEISIKEIADAKTLLGSKNYGRYKFHLETMNCIEASNMLRLAFSDHYPKIAKLMMNDTERGDEWSYLFVARRYLDLHFCYSAKKIDLVKLLNRNEPGRIGYCHHRRQCGKGKGKKMGLRSKLTFEDLYVLIDQGHLPALIFLADLAGNGTYFENDAEVEYFMLVRACAKNYRCNEISGRIEMLAEELPEKAHSSLKVDAEDTSKTLFGHFTVYVPATKQ